MDEAVQVHSGLVNLKEVLIIQVLRVRRLSGKDHLHCLVEVLDFLTQVGEVEIVADVVLVDLNEELVAFQVAEPADPASATLAVVVIVQVMLLLLHSLLVLMHIVVD